MMIVKDVTSKVEKFDKNFPCAECLIKIFCSELCPRSLIYYQNKDRDYWEKYRNWLQSIKPQE